MHFFHFIPLTVRAAMPNSQIRKLFTNMTCYCCDVTAWQSVLVNHCENKVLCVVIWNSELIKQEPSHWAPDKQTEIPITSAVRSTEGTDTSHCCRDPSNLWDVSGWMEKGRNVMFGSINDKCVNSGFKHPSVSCCPVRSSLLVWTLAFPGRDSWHIGTHHQGNTATNMRWKSLKLLLSLCWQVSVIERWTWH